MPGSYLDVKCSLSLLSLSLHCFAVKISQVLIVVTELVTEFSVLFLFGLWSPADRSNWCAESELFPKGRRYCWLMCSRQTCDLTSQSDMTSCSAQQDVTKKKLILQIVFSVVAEAVGPGLRTSPLQERNISFISKRQVGPTEEKNLLPTTVCSKAWWQSWILPTGVVGWFCCL